MDKWQIEKCQILELGQFVDVVFVDDLICVYLNEMVSIHFTAASVVILDFFFQLLMLQSA